MHENKNDKNITIISTSKAIGQAKIVGEIVNTVMQEGNSDLKKIAVVLADENLLHPILHSLPTAVDAINITMGFSSKNNPAQLLISKLFKLHTNALNKDEKNYVFYYKEVLEILNHPLVEPHIHSNELITSYWTVESQSCIFAACIKTTHYLHSKFCAAVNGTIC